MEAVTDFIFLGSKIIAHGDCSHKIKMLAPWKESYDKPKVCLGKAMVFPVVMYGCESSTIKKAECRKTEAFDL